MVKNIIQVYANEDIKSEIKRAAEIKTLSLGAFCRSVLIEKAREILKQNSEGISA